MNKKNQTKAKRKKRQIKEETFTYRNPIHMLSQLRLKLHSCCLQLFVLLEIVNTISKPIKCTTIGIFLSFFSLCSIFIVSSCSQFIGFWFYFPFFSLDRHYLICITNRSDSFLLQFFFSFKICFQILLHRWGPIVSIQRFFFFEV